MWKLQKKRKRKKRKRKRPFLRNNILLVLLFVAMGRFVFVCIEVVLLCFGEKGRGWPVVCFVNGSESEVSSDPIKSKTQGKKPSGGWWSF